VRVVFCLFFLLSGLRDNQTNHGAVQFSSIFHMLDILDVEKRRRCWVLFCVSVIAFPAFVVEVRLNQFVFFRMEL
jgi:hypothetical protein